MPTRKVIGEQEVVEEKVGVDNEWNQPQEFEGVLELSMHVLTSNSFFCGATTEHGTQLAKRSDNTAAPTSNVWLETGKHALLACVLVSLK